MGHRVADKLLQELNSDQQRAVQHGDTPLLILAGAGTGKTMTLVHRVAALITRGVEPSRILLLTYTRRAAGEMLRRTGDLLARRRTSSPGSAEHRVAARVWGGTFHATATRLLRQYAATVGLNPGFTIHDRSDSEDFLDALRTELKLGQTGSKFPKKETLMAIYSHCVNAQLPLETMLAAHYASCASWSAEMKRLFELYAERKQQSDILDFDDLLLFWLALVSDPDVGPRVRGRFDAVLVDEYQDTNRLQCEILRRLRPDGRSLTVVGDDAQSIYSFRAATVRNILDFPQHFPGTEIVRLEQNYRSVQPILDATNAVISKSRETHGKRLWTARQGGEKPLLVTCTDDACQAEFVANQILQHREAGIDLRRQAVLFRASHNSIILEAELARCQIPFVKYGGLRFVEAAHVKDVVAFLRLAENYRDLAAGLRVLKLLPGIGPQKATQLLTTLQQVSGNVRVWESAKIPAATRPAWPKLLKLMTRLMADAARPLSRQIASVLKFYEPFLQEKYDNAEARWRDLEQLQQLSERFADRNAFITDLALDPPSSTNDLKQAPDEEVDQLVLSTIHSAKGLEWDVVYVITATDTNLPSIRTHRDPEQLEEERRLFYVALTRARQWLYVVFPQHSYQYSSSYGGDPYALARLTRFITPSVKKLFRPMSGWQPHDMQADASAAAGPWPGKRKLNPRWF